MQQTRIFPNILIYRMNKSVHQPKGNDDRIGAAKSVVNPTEKRNGKVMVEMEPRHLRLFLSKHKEDRIEQIYQFGDEIHMAQIKFGDNSRTGVVKIGPLHVEHVQTKVVIDKNDSIEEIGVPHGHDQIVDQHYWF